MHRKPIVTKKIVARKKDINFFYINLVNNARRIKEKKNLEKLKDSQIFFSFLLLYIY